MTAELESAIEQAQAAVQVQGDTVRSLKASLKDGKAQQAEVDAAIAKLQQLKLELTGHQKAYEAATGKVSGQNKEAFRAAMVRIYAFGFFFCFLF
jgi:glycyl-tRNA synthetase